MGLNGPSSVIGSSDTCLCGRKLRRRQSTLATVCTFCKLAVPPSRQLVISPPVEATYGLSGMSTPVSTPSSATSGTHTMHHTDSMPTLPTAPSSSSTPKGDVSPAQPSTADSKSSIKSPKITRRQLMPHSLSHQPQSALVTSSSATAELGPGVVVVPRPWPRWTQSKYDVGVADMLSRQSVVCTPHGTTTTVSSGATLVNSGHHGHSHGAGSTSVTYNTTPNGTDAKQDACSGSQAVLSLLVSDLPPTGVPSGSMPAKACQQLAFVSRLPSELQESRSNQVSDGRMHTAYPQCVCVCVGVCIGRVLHRRDALKHDLHVRGVVSQESAQHRIADYHARDAAGAWMILACQSVVITHDDALLDEVCRMPGQLLQLGLGVDEAIIRAALTCIMHDPRASPERLQAVFDCALQGVDSCRTLCCCCLGTMPLNRLLHLLLFVDQAFKLLT